MMRVNHNSPQSAMRTSALVAPDCEPTASTFFTTSIPSTTLPKTTCLPSNHVVSLVHKKNCEPLVFGPAFALDKMPGPGCFYAKFSSSNLLPKMDLPPVPLRAVKSPPWHMKPGITRWNGEFL